MIKELEKLMNLRSFLINSNYHSARDNPYHEFFIPALSNSIEYKRYGGFFSSKNLALCAEGIQEFIKNKGTMKLVLTPFLSEQDIDAIKKGQLNREKKIEDLWIEELDSIKDKFQEDHVRALSWMLGQDPPLLEIKIAIPKDTMGNILSGEKIERMGIATNSVGIFQDELGNIISFRGIIKTGYSDDEFVDIVVHKNWIPSHENFVSDDLDKFMELWDESSIYLEPESKVHFEIINLPEVIAKKLLEFKPKSVEELSGIFKLPKLKNYQLEARNSWLDHGCRGIFEMATGTGKTFCAIGSMKEIHALQKNLFVVIACPSKVLVNQWEGELKIWNYDSINTLKGKSDWKEKIQKFIRDEKFGIESKIGIRIIITTYATFSKQEFVEEIERIQAPIMFIADEVHSAGTQSIKKALLEKYEFRLGLSATPSRYFDPSGTDFLFNYFRPLKECDNCKEHGSIVYSLTLKQAIPQFLTEYYYYPYYIDLEEDELIKYKKLTKFLAQEYNKKQKERNHEMLENIMFQRAKIIKNANKKIECFQQIIDKNKDLNYAIIYCAPSNNPDGTENLSQMQKAQEILNKVPIPNHIVKSSDVSQSEVVEILDKLESGLYKAVLAIKMLDEGLDVPPLKTAILLSSTGNPKEFIQRRGRVLRKWSGTYPDGTKKDFATIHDIFVIPFLNEEIDPLLFMAERHIVEKELERHQDMVESSKNPEYGYEQIKKIRKKYNI